jgi:uncharacterized protein YciI
MSMPPTPVRHFLLTYTLAPDYLERRPAFRAEHLALARAAAERGELLLGGALDPADEAMLLFAGEDAATAEAFARADPYVENGLVAAWRVREWLTVVGEEAANPV